MFGRTLPFDSRCGPSFFPAWFWPQALSQGRPVSYMFSFRTVALMCVCDRRASTMSFAGFLPAYPSQIYGSPCGMDPVIVEKDSLHSYVWLVMSWRLA